MRRRKGFEHPGSLSVPAYGPTRPIPVPAKRDGGPSLRTPRRDRRVDPCRAVPTAHPPGRAERGGEEHDDPDARELDPRRALLRTSTHALYVARRVVRARFDLRPQEGPVFADHARIPPG